MWDRTSFTVLCILKCWPKTSRARNQDNHQNLDPSLLPNRLWLLFMRMKQEKTIFFEKKKSKKSDSKKLCILKLAMQHFFAKISQIGLGIERIFASSRWKAKQELMINLVISPFGLEPTLTMRRTIVAFSEYLNFTNSLTKLVEHCILQHSVLGGI